MFVRLLSSKLKSLSWNSLKLQLLSSHLPSKLILSKQKFLNRISLRTLSVAIVKQDCNEDLYCSPPDATVWQTISSTLLRSGPVSFFSFFSTTFLLVKTESDPECNIWREKADPLGWASLQWFESFRDHIPGRDHGQSSLALSVEEIDWSKFDIIVSIDVSVPARITRQYPQVVWCYYVRELKAPSWTASLQAPIDGQDLFLSQYFNLIPDRRHPHVLSFPYHFHHVGVFHQLVPAVIQESTNQVRHGIFVEYHSAYNATDEQLSALSVFGPVYAHRSSDVRFDELTGDRIPDRTMAGPALEALLRSKYHVKWAGRSTFGTAKVEAIACGCLCLTDPAIDGTPFLHSPASLVSGFDNLLKRLELLESNHDMYYRELSLQRQRVDYLCCYRPANDLLDACERIIQKRLK